jgi:hypothetical protein
MFGLAKLLHDLREMDYAVEDIMAGGQAFAIIKNYEVATGRFMGRIIDLGIPAPENYPLAVGASIQVKATPQLFDLHDTLQGVRNIIQSPLGNEWRYWSLNFGQGNHSTRRLLSQINGVFDRA